jgi:uncharacterized membrane-anchored protein YhcB (DUF1043 family)
MGGDYQVAMVAVVAGLVLVAAMRAGRHVAVQWKSLRVTLDGVNEAVNHRPPEQPTLYEHAAELRTEVGSLHRVMSDHLKHDADSFAEVRTALDRIAERLNALETD